MSDSTLSEERQEFPFVHIKQHEIFRMEDWGPNALLNTNARVDQVEEVQELSQ